MKKELTTFLLCSSILSIYGMNTDQKRNEPLNPHYQKIVESEINQLKKKGYTEKELDAERQELVDYYNKMLKKHS